MIWPCILFCPRDNPVLIFSKNANLNIGFTSVLDILFSVWINKAKTNNIFPPIPEVNYFINR